MPMRPLEQQTILITGSTDGIGFKAAVDLAKRGIQVIVHGRTLEKAEDAAKKVRQQSNNNDVETVAANFESLDEVHKMTQDLKRRFSAIDALINNAGVYMNERKESQDGHEVTFQVNYLAQVLLTLQLLEPLHQETETRIVNVASVAHQSAELDLDDLENENFDSYRAYANSKLEMVLFTYELSRRLKSTNIMVNCLHPGVINTKLLEAGFGPIGGSIEEGAEVEVYVATSEECKGVSGAYFNQLQREKSSRPSYDENLAHDLWNQTVKIIKLSQAQLPQAGSQAT